jgi:hypothetical protein
VPIVYIYLLFFRDFVVASTAVIILLSIVLLGGATMPTMLRLGLKTTGAHPSDDQQMLPQVDVNLQMNVCH